MSLIRLNTAPTARQLKQFGIAWFCVFTIVSFVLWKRYEVTTIASVMGATAIVVPLIGWFSPRVMLMAYLALTYLTYPIGLVVSHVLLALVYYCVITPIGLLMRSVRYDPMRRRFDRSADTYWLERTEDRPPASYFRQF